MSQSEKVSLYSKVGQATEDGDKVNYSSVRLLELPAPLLELIESSYPPELTIKPSPNGTAILSTPSKSFLLREVDQSNSLMLFAPSETDGFHLVHTAKQYFEVVSNPNRVKLDNLLPEWDGETMDIDVRTFYCLADCQGIQKVRMYELRRQIAASDEEIDNALDVALAVEIDGTHFLREGGADEGYVYRMSPTYATHVLDLIITTATADSISLNKLFLDDIRNSMASDEDRGECIDTVLRIFSDTPIERTSPPSFQLTAAYSLSKDKVVRWYGIRSLSSLNNSVPIATFLSTWQSSLPTAFDTARPELTLLTGSYYHPSPSTVQYLPSAELSTVPEQRFAQLFGVKEKWGMSEIMPFLEGCVESGKGWEKKAERECQKWARVKGGIVTKR